MESIVHHGIQEAFMVAVLGLDRRGPRDAEVLQALEQIGMELETGERQA